MRDDEGTHRSLLKKYQKKRSLKIVKTCLYLCLICVSTISFAQDEDLYNEKNSLEFANYLFASNQYNLAAKEYERVLFLGEGNADSIKLQIVRSFSLGGNQQKSVERAKSLYGNNLSEFPAPFAKRYTKDLFLLRDFSQLNFFLQEKQSQLPRREKLFASTSMYLYNMNWEGAHLSLDLVKQAGMEEAAFFEKYIEEGEKLSSKSPLLAGTFSTLIPGTGKLYTGDWQDGIFSFIMVGALAWQSYRGFNNDGVKSVRGWVFGAIGFGFYTGNIWGSVRSAKKHNNLKKEALRQKVTQHFKKKF